MGNHHGAPLVRVFQAENKKRKFHSNDIVLFPKKVIVKVRTAPIDTKRKIRWDQKSQKMKTSFADISIPVRNLLPLLTSGKVVSLTFSN